MLGAKQQICANCSDCFSACNNACVVDHVLSKDVHIVSDHLGDRLQAVLQPWRLNNVTLCCVPWRCVL